MHSDQENMINIDNRPLKQSGPNINFQYFFFFFMTQHRVNINVKYINICTYTDIWTSRQVVRKYNYIICSEVL